MSKQAVLLTNLGSPDSTSIPDVRKYLEEFLMDGRVIDSPSWIRAMVVYAFILPFRPKNSAEAYEKVWTDEGSPLIVTSKQQQQLVQEQLDIPVYLSMRYGNPSTPSVLKKMKEDGISDFFLIPLYPHYSMASYETAVVQVQEELLNHFPEMKFSLMQPYYKDPGYIEALTQSAAPYLEKEYDHLLFSYHGIPERHLRKSDPSHGHCLVNADCCSTCHPAHATCYKHQCLETTRKFVNKLQIPEEKYSISFQSRLGRDPWLKPYTDFVLEELPEKGVKKLLVICPAFVSDCLETLEEIAMSGKESFLNAGGDFFEMIPCVNTHERWIQFLVDEVRKWKV